MVTCHRSPACPERRRRVIVRQCQAPAADPGAPDRRCGCVNGTPFYWL